MSQQPEHEHREQPRQPYGQEHGQPQGQPHGQPQRQPHGQASGWPPPWPPQQPQAGTPYSGPSGTHPLPPSPPFGPPSGTPSGTPQSGRRGPGWIALIVAMVVTALLAGGLALVGARAWDGQANLTATPSTSAQVNPPVPSSGDVSATDWTAVADAVSSSVVTIQVASQQEAGQGSGVILDTEGNILTNNHVVTGAGANADMRVVLADGRVFSDVTVVGLDPATDLAVVRISNPPADLHPATLGDSSKVTPGQPVMAIGNPLGLSDTVTTGIVSAVDRPVTTLGESAGSPFDRSSVAEPVVTNAIQTDAAINPGNSGGALVDATGTVIGINSSIASTGSQAGNIGLGFAIPINEAKRIADELISNGEATHAILGVSLKDGLATEDGVDRQAAVIAEVASGTPAEKAGLQVDDAVTAVDGESVNGAESLTAQIRERAPGTHVTLTIVRDGATQKVDVTLGTRQDG
jgi:putative serine protease PepD